MLRVLHCIYDDIRNPWLAGGGAIRVAEIYRRLAGRLAVEVVTGNHPGALDEDRDGVHYRRIGAAAPYPLSRLTYAREAAHLLAREPYDVGIYDFSVYSPVRVPPGRPVGLVVHMLMGPTAHLRWGKAAGALLARTEQSLLRRGRWLSTVSQETARELRAFLPGDRHVEVVGNGVADRFFEVARRDAGYLLYYGRFDIVQKGADTIVAAMALLARSHPSARLIMAGRGKDRDRVAAMIAERGLTDRIEIRDEVGHEEAVALFAGAEALVMASRFEGLPIVPMEAMAAGVPIIATRLPGFAEVLGDSGAGILVPVDDAAALASAAASLLDSPERAAAMSEAARRGAERFSWDVVAEKHLHFIETIAGAAGHRKPPVPGT